MRWGPLLVTTLLAGCHAPQPTTPPPEARTSFGDGMVTFDGKVFHLHCEGAGTPTVILEAGNRGSAWAWSDELPVVAKYTRVCAFDQLGGGYSGPEPAPRDDAAAADDTWKLLTNAGERGPFVIVGYGLGDDHARAFGEQHPDVTAGVVRLGPGFPSREQHARVNEAIRAATHAARLRTPSHDDSLPPPAPMSGDDGLVVVGRSTMHVHCAGSGTPVVVFDAGRGGGGWHFSETQRAIAKVTRACVFDRLGNGLSGASTPPHTSPMMVEELRAMLAAIHTAPPYVLVGHSFGGMNAQLFASEHPAEVAGMVLVDPMSEKVFFDQLVAAPPGSATRLALEQGFEDSLADGDFPAVRASCAQMAGARRAFGDLPLVVLHHGIPLEDATLEQDWTAAVEAVAASSTNSAFVTAENTGHMIPYDQPALVSAAVEEVLTAARTHSKVDGARVHAKNRPVLAPPAW